MAVLEQVEWGSGMITEPARRAKGEAGFDALRVIL